jgi:hypothetical protein
MGFEGVAMSESSPSEDTLGPPESIPLAHTKFSDLVGYLQLLQARVGLTLTASGLTATASGVLAPLLPFGQLPKGSLPIPVYFAGFALCACVFNALGAIAIPSHLETLIFGRLKCRELPAVDYVERELHQIFANELIEKARALGVALEWLELGVTLLITYVLISLTLVSIQNLDVYDYMRFSFQWHLQWAQRYFYIGTDAMSINIFYTLSTMLWIYLLRVRRRAGRRAT